MLTDLPNVLTLSRIAAIPLLVVLVALRLPAADLAACIVFSAAAITDYYDGKLARSRRQQSDLGRMLDPIADKLLVGAALMMLVGQGRLSGLALYPAIVIMLREILVSGLREYLAGIRIGLPVTRLAKWKTGFQMGALGTLLAGDTAAHFLHLAFLPVSAIGEAMLWVAAGLTLWTGWDYLTAGLAPRHRCRDRPLRKRQLPVVKVLPVKATGSEGLGHRRLVRQRQDHAADRAAAAAARARPDGVHRQAHASRLRHGPAGQGHVPPPRGRRAARSWSPPATAGRCCTRSPARSHRCRNCWRACSRSIWCWWRASRRIRSPSWRCIARRWASRRSGTTRAGHRRGGSRRAAGELRPDAAAAERSGGRGGMGAAIPAVEQRAL